MEQITGGGGWAAAGCRMQGSPCEIKSGEHRGVPCWAGCRAGRHHLLTVGRQMRSMQANLAAKDNTFQVKLGKLEGVNRYSWMQQCNAGQGTSTRNTEVEGELLCQQSSWLMQGHDDTL
eukprot:scaffold49281_cov17-Tisochrysis_lutea.AAC.2